MMKTLEELLIKEMTESATERTRTLLVVSTAAVLPPKKRSSVPYWETTAWSPPRERATS